MVVYATGYAQYYRCFDHTVLHRLHMRDDGLYLYRSLLHPDVKDLAFVGACADTTSPLLTAGLQAQWLAALLKGRIRLPSRWACPPQLVPQALRFMNPQVPCIHMYG